MNEQDLVDYLIEEGYKEVFDSNCLRFVNNNLDDVYDEIRIELGRVTREYYSGGEYDKDNSFDEEIDDLEIYDGRLVKILL